MGRAVDQQLAEGRTEGLRRPQVPRKLHLTDPRLSCVVPTNIDEVALPFGGDAPCFKMGPQPHLIVPMGGHDLSLGCA